LVTPKTVETHVRHVFEKLRLPSTPADNLDAPEDDPRPQLVAASLTAAFNLLAERKISKGEAWTTIEVAKQIDPVFTFPRGGLDALSSNR
jgi:hypothetical protein